VMVVVVTMLAACVAKGIVARGLRCGTHDYSRHA
jgi:hypothetical protein